MMLQTNPNNRPNCDQLLSNETVVKRITAIKEGKDIISGQHPIQMLGTIKLPKNMSEINQRLPKKKMYQEMEAANLMNYDVNINKKPNNPMIDLTKKDNNNNIYDKEIRDLISKNKENVAEIKDRNPPVNNLNANPNNANLNQNRINMINNIGNNQNNLIKKEINLNPNPNPNMNIMIRPVSAKNDAKLQDKSPIKLKNPLPEQENINNILRNNEQIKIRLDNKNLQPSVAKSPANIANYNSNNNQDRSNQISARPQSAKLVAQNNDLHNKINQINQIARKNINQRVESPIKVNPLINNIIKKPVGQKSPRNRSPISDNRINIINNPISRPASGREKINSGNNQVIIRNDNKVVIEKVNYDRALIMQNPSNQRINDHKKPNYQYGNNQIMVNNKNNLINPSKVYENINSRPMSNNGPRILNIGGRK
jgi:hypothetical protein